MTTVSADAPTASQAAIDHLRAALEAGLDWPEPLLQAMSIWTLPEESYRGRVNTYFIAGEAFDWLLLAERLIDAAKKHVPKSEREELLFHGRFPAHFDASQLGGLLGVDKYRGYLNYHYGVTVEEALQLTAELELQKRDVANGLTDRDDYTENAFRKLYRAPRSELLKEFRRERGAANRRSIGVTESKAFTYWLFKRRLRVSDKPRVASDTRKGLEQLRRMARTPPAHLPAAEQRTAPVHAHVG